MSNSENNSIQRELYDFLVKFEMQEPKKYEAAQGADIWNEIYVPRFRNFKVFVHLSGSELIIVMPTHMSGSDDIVYHVIREEMDAPDHNGKYLMMSQEEFRKEFKCNFIHSSESVKHETTTKNLSKLTDHMVNNLPKIKKLKNKTVEDIEESKNFFSRLILDFLMKSGK